MPASISGAQTPPLRVATALKSAADKTGADFDFLYKVAQRESSLNPAAQAKTSSAAGLFQFIEQTWLGAVKQHGADHGLKSEADAITRGADGRYTVSDASVRRDILDQRFDPNKAAALAGEVAMDNKTHLEKKLGRKVNGPELYAAHFLGPSGAVKLLSAPHHTSAAELSPAAAKANKPVFYEGGREKSVGEVIESFRQTIATASKARRSVTPEATMTPAMLASSPVAADRSVQAAAISSDYGKSAPIGPVPTYAPQQTPVMQASAGNGRGDAPANNAASNVEALIRKFGGVDSVSPLAFVVLEAIDPTRIVGRLTP